MPFGLGDRGARLALLCIAGLLARCRSADVSPPIAPPPPSPVAQPAPRRPDPPPSPVAPPSVAIVLGGTRLLENGAWMGGDAVAVTHTELWRFHPEEPQTLHVTELSRPLASDAVLTTDAGSSRVAVGLEGGSVDLFREGKRIRTLPAVAKGYPVLELRFSPDGATLAVTRTGDTWLEQTVFYDATTGAPRGTVAGGSVVFDATSTFVAARGGVFTVADGREVARWREGFFVLRANGAMTDMSAVPRGEEVMAADFVARGFFKGTAFYAGDKEVALIDPSTARVVKIPASCAPAAKLSSEADAARARVLGVCTDGVLVTDLERRATARIRVPVQKGGHVLAPTVWIPPDGKTFLVRGLDYPASVVDPDSGSARDASASDITAFAAFSPDQRCVRAGTPRNDIHCQASATRDDGAFRLRVGDGLTVTDVRSGKTVIAWGMTSGDAPIVPTSPAAILETRVALAWHRGGIDVRAPADRRLRYRLGAASPDAPEPFPATPACGKGEAWPQESTDTYAVYTTLGAKGESMCHCSAHGCTTRAVPSGFFFLAGGEDGALLAETTNPTMTETVLRLERPGKPGAQTKLPASCIKGAFGPNGRVFLACEANEVTTLYELSPSDLSIVARRPAPPLGRVDVLARLGEGLLVTRAYRIGEAGMLLPPGWVANEATHEVASVYAWPEFGILQTADGKVQLSGDVAAAASALRCFDGRTLRPFSWCRDAVSSAPGTP